MTFRLPPLRRPAALSTLAPALAIAVTLAAALAGCASPGSRFYTLSPSDDTARTAPAATAGNPAWLIELAPVDVPPQVSKAQLVVQTDATQVKVLEQERWASMPGDEIRRALSGDLTQQLDTIDVYGSPRPDGVPVYRVSVNVQRFESWPGSHALIDAVWSVRALDSQTVMTCRSVLNEPVGDGYDALVIGHRRAVSDLSMAISSGVRSLAAMPQVSVPAATKKGAKSAMPTKPVTSVACPTLVPAASAS
ncbi:membrane integrity-associated transporter subunit PqiC [Paraburkholderia sp. Ac-20340]|uniref:PqiC family protein n=1 Tax=Paraburkholderia sp. Ac-20340 TaxID=2703888 RepID=UPI00197DCE56|nr:PqiC family protein [Paraburkholderia sp. Ac-20340]MBN3852689.1 membrane integrity-associated transporter subunit PqiC [Paraburkholderia sp. Ac-20340]